ncbi:D-3-phosphoglycerate dehydrogenase [Desulfocucumis palustris]|uniref:2-oxoglutarate reductase n=1 Tax=Desulfocucumis palustris TaxID=1898651 RepID=A0A2L2XEZ8_9FIRM|nr:phosphoglycerate dehydrogenase [Desulfocucumis palustris]GBF34273.1 D-3-phosphoglycerate dehydrogenase [Desulfocucumis palustris]
MSFKIVVTPRSFGAASPRPMELLQNKGYEIVRNSLGRPLKEMELIRLAGGADALLVGIDEVTDRVVDSLPNLKVISKYGVGVDNIALGAASRRGIPVTNTPGVNTGAVADLAIGLMLSVARQISAADHSTKNGEWKRFMGSSLYGKTVGILGTGKIGRAVAKRLRGFEVELLLYDEFKDSVFAGEVGGRYADLPEIYGKADFISLHLPLMPATGGLIGEKELRAMKPDAIVVNTARGGLVDEKALVRALREKWIRGAALDAFAAEPPRDEELLGLPNIVLTPHIGAYTEEAVLMMGMQSARNVIAVLEGKQPENVVNEIPKPS